MHLVVRFALLVALVAATPAFADVGGFYTTFRLGASQGFAPSQGAAIFPPSTGMITMIPFEIGAVSGLNTSVGTFTSGLPDGFNNVARSTSSEAGLQVVIAIPGTLTNLSWWRAGITGGGGTFLVNERHELNSTLVQCDEADNGLQGVAPNQWAFCTDNAHGTHYLAGERLGWLLTPVADGGGNPPTGTVDIHGSVLFQGDNANEQPFYGSTVNSVVAANSGQWSGFQNSVPINGTAENLIWFCFKEPGTLDHLYMKLSAAPGGTGGANKSTLTMRRAPNAASPADTTITASIQDSGVSNSDLVDTVAISAGDCVDMKWTAVGSPASSRVQYGLRWVPTAANHGVYGTYQTTNSTTSNLTRWFTAVGSAAASGSSTANQNNLYLPTAPATITISNFGVVNDSTTTSSNKRTYSLTTTTDNGAGGWNTPTDVIACTQANGATGCDSGATTVNVTPGTFMSGKHVNILTPTAGTWERSFFSAEIH